MMVYKQLLEDVCEAQRQNRPRLSKTEQQLIALVFSCIKEAIKHERFPTPGKVRKEVELIVMNFKYDTVFVWVSHKACAKEIKAIKHQPGEKLNLEAITSVMQEIGLKRTDKGRHYPDAELSFAYQLKEETL